MLWCRMWKMASSFALLIATAIIVHHATDAGQIDVDPSTLTAKGKSNCVSASFSVNAETDVDLFNMPSLSLPLAVGGTEEAEVAVFTKTEATQRTVDGGLVEVVWHGSLSDSERFGHATLIQKSDGNVAGILSTETSAFTLKTLPDGSLELEESFWADDFEDSVFEEEYFEESDSIVDADAGSDESFTSAMVVNSPMSVTSETSWGQGISVFDEGDNRSLRDENRILQQYRNVDVLILITNRAMCSAARLSAGCALNARSRAPIEGMVKVVEEQTNAAMQAVGVRTSVTFVQIIHLNASYDGRPTSDTLRELSSSQTVASWRAGAGADLVAMVTGEDPNGLIGGLSYLNRAWSVSSYNAFQYYSMSHEIFHCFGANHDRANSRTQHPYGHGLQVPGRFRTIMAYKCASGSCPRVPYLSANGFKYNGVSLGNAATNNARLVAENSQVTANLVRSVTRSSDTSDQESQPVARPVPRPVAQPRQATQPAPKPATTLRVVPNYDTVPDSSPVTNPGTAPVQYIASTDSQCRSNPVCAELSTEGFCCPNTGGVYMACCTQANEPSSSTKIEQDSNSTHWWWKSTTSCTGTACVQVDKLTTKSGSLASTTSLIVAIVAGMATMLATIF